MRYLLILYKMEYRNKINPKHSLRTAYEIKGTRQKIIVAHNPSETDQNQLLTLKFPNLGSDNVIIPGMANLSFNTELSLTAYLNRTLVSNIGRVIAVKFKGNEILSTDNFGVFECYRDLWKTKLKKRNTYCTVNCMKLRIISGDKDATNAQDVAIANAYGNKFIIPLDFEMLDSTIPYHQSELGNKLYYEITFNNTIE